MAGEKKKEATLEEAIYATIKWFDLLDRPVTELELVERLVGEQGSVTLREVRQMLRESVWLKERLDYTKGFIYKRGREGLVSERLRREAKAQRKWKIVRRAGRMLVLVPFVRGLAGSGSLAINNTRAESDLDIFVLVAPGRIWLARLGLLLVGELTGRRRRYWDVQAPDKLCLNHYVSVGQLQVVLEIRNMYTAMMYTSLVPIYGELIINQFVEANKGWMREYISWHGRPSGLSTYTQELPVGLEWLKRLGEALLAEPVWDGAEKVARAVQLYFIRQHQQGRSGRVVTNDLELAFHPDSKVPGLLARFGSKQCIRY